MCWEPYRPALESNRIEDITNKEDNLPAQSRLIVHFAYWALFLQWVRRVSLAWDGGLIMAEPGVSLGTAYVRGKLWVKIIGCPYTYSVSQEKVNQIFFGKNSHSRTKMRVSMMTHNIY